jgi:hypothetical protein
MKGETPLAIRLAQDVANPETTGIPFGGWAIVIIDTGLGQTGILCVKIYEVENTDGTTALRVKFRAQGLAVLGGEGGDPI